MYSIKLICTHHSNAGKCNSRELNRLLEEKCPNVIFEDLSPAVHKECYEKDRFTMESEAIKMYLKNYSAEIIPAVGTEIGKVFLEKCKINESHSGCKRLLGRLYGFAYFYGFDYLNSEYVHQLFDVLARLEQDIMGFIKDEEVNKIYKQAYENIDKYENDIVENIYKYSAENEYKRGVLLIDAAHRKSMIEKIEEYNDAQSLKLNWTFYDRGYCFPS